MSDPAITPEEARRLREAATPGPWWLAERTPDGTVQYVCAGERYPQSRLGHIVAQADSGYTAKSSWDQRHRDLALIAAAPSLAAEVERLSAEVERLNEEDNQEQMLLESINERLSGEVERLRAALQRIADEDYRGPRPSGAVIAAATLTDEGGE